MRDRPNWWVILAVSLGLMALLVATAGGNPRAAHRTGGSAQASSRISPRSGARPDEGAPSLRPTTTTTTPTTTTTDAPSQASAADVASSLHTAGAGSPAAAPVPPPASSSVTTTTAGPATTTTTVPGSGAEVAADRTQDQGYLNPPLDADNKYGFTGTGAMEVSVVWSGDTYLSLQVSCTSGDQSAGGTSAMEASLPDASGSCFATVSEPASETVALTYTISIGPAGG
ncbi:MAG: hypothetical protein WAL61_13505 [Acidimicrobiales bacterium]